MIKNILRKLKEALFGIIICRKIIRSNPGAKILMTFTGIGEPVFMLSYVRAYQEVHGIDKIKILTDNPESDLYKCFGIRKEELIPMKHNKLITILRFYWSDIGVSFRHRHPEIIEVTAHAYLRPELLRYSDFPCLASVVKAIFKLPQSQLPSLYQIPSADEIILKLSKEGVLDIHRTVLINPYAVTCEGVPMELFQRIADMLRENQIKVVTSAHGDQQVLEGTVGVDYPLGQAIALCSACGFVIGLRSGFMDLVTYADAEIITVDHVDFWGSGLYLLEECWPQNNRIKTFHFGHKQLEQTAEEIVNHVIEKIKDI